MKPRTSFNLIFLITSIAAICDVSFATTNAYASPICVTAYYPVQEQISNLPPDKVDYSAFSNLVQFSIVPTSDGQIDQIGQYAVTPAISKAVVSRAHNAGDKVIICLGGSNSGPLLEPVITPQMRGKFISNLLHFVSSRGYDGIDVDMEPIQDSDFSNYEGFVRELHSRMKALNPELVLSAAATPEPGNEPAMYASIQNNFDLINIMTYDLSGTWDGWKTWYNSNLLNDPPLLMTATVKYPSALDVLQRYIKAGIPKSKLSIGCAFYGDVWQGASGPTQSIQGVTITSIGYNQIMDSYYHPNLYHWDEHAKAAYLSIVSPQPAQSKFISYDDARLVTEKVLFARRHGLGGISIWEIGQGYRPNQPAGSRDVLLDAVKRAWREPLSSTASLK